MTRVLPATGTEAPDSIGTYLREVHRDLDQVLAQPGGMAADPRVAHQPLDAAIGVLSQHLAATESVLLPALRRWLPDGHTRAATLVGHDRELEQALRLIEQRIYGDMLAPEGTVEELRAGLADLLAAHAGAEQAAVAELERRCGPARCGSVLAQLRAADGHGPTRPHPHLLGSRMLGHLALAALSLWDRVLDEMDGRTVPDSRPRRPRRRQMSRWDLYLFGGGQSGGTPGRPATPREEASRPVAYPPDRQRDL